MSKEAQTPAQVGRGEFAGGGIDKHRNKADITDLGFECLFLVNKPSANYQSIKPNRDENFEFCGSLKTELEQDTN